MFRRSRPPRGQHFLHDRRILQRIASSLPLRPGALVVEIGAGEGALTEFLLAAGARVTAIEIEPALAQHLRERFEGADGIEILEADVLNIDFATLIAERSSEPALVAGNLPYYITSPILRKVFDASVLVEQAVFLMQHEVAKRVTARKNSRDYGFLSVLCCLYSEPKLLFGVAAGAFRPPPRVSSAVVGMTMRRDRPADPDLVEFLKKCFAQPRKKLLNNLSGRYDRAVLGQFEQSQQRAQQLDLEDLREFRAQLEQAARKG
jgi:16S rRNA (adenine1518-N6/adenine1519-N6)-dimethyltransferase